MNLTYNVLIYIIENSTILIVSLLLHLFIFGFIFSRYLGSPLKETFYFILYKKQNLFILFIFFVSLFLIVYLKNNFIYLEDKVSITTTIENVNKDLYNFNFFATPEETEKLYPKELDPQTPDWRNNFISTDFSINSPLESNSSLTQFALDTLNNHLIINFITVYLLLMLLIIIICKFVLNKDINFNRLEKYPLGFYINKFLIKYISIWQKSSNVWIFFIIIPLIFFNTIVTFSTYHLILLLK